MNNNFRKDIMWVNIVKIIAWGGVLLQHVNGLLYNNQHIFRSAWYAVALFVFIGGYLQALSYERRGTVNIRKRIINLLSPYIIATALYILYENHILDLESYIMHLIHFDASGPFYYIWVYLQLIIITPVMIGVLKWADEKNKYMRNLIILISICLVCYLTVNFTTVFELSSSGGHFLGGIWLFFWYMGMRSKKFLDEDFKHPRIIFYVSLLLFVLWEYIFIIKENIFWLGSMFNDSQIRGLNWLHAIQMLLIVMVVKSGVCLARQYNLLIKVMEVVALLGKNTIYIFLYHMLFLELGQNLSINNIWIKRIVIITIMVVGPLCIQQILTCFHGWVKENIYNKVNIR